MTDKEQALVAAAYRLAADVCERHQVAARDAPYEIRDLTPADAEKHLRELMMEVAKRCNNELGFVWLGDEDDMALIDEVLNGK